MTVTPRPLRGQPDLGPAVKQHTLALYAVDSMFHVPQVHRRSPTIHAAGPRAALDPSMRPTSPSTTRSAAASPLVTTKRVASATDSMSDSVRDLGTPVLLYDGECGFCAGSVQFVLKHEGAARHEALRFAPLQGKFGAMVRERFPDVGGVDSVVWFDPSRHDSRAVRLKSAAALAALAHLGGLWRIAAAVGMLVPRIARDMVYDAIAKRRFELAAPACLIPTAETRSRFLA